MKFRFLIWFIFLLYKTVLTQEKDGFCQIENPDNLGEFCFFQYFSFYLPNLCRIVTCSIVFVELVEKTVTVTV